MGVEETLRLLGATLLLLPGVLGGTLVVTYPVSQICALRGSSVLIPCTYEYPDNATVTERKWTNLPNNSNYDQPPFIYHSREEHLDTNYTGRVQYTEQDRSCSFKLTGIRSSDSRKYYFRITIDRKPKSVLGLNGVNLSVADGPLTVKVKTTRHNSVILEGDNVTLTCSTQSCSPNQTEFTWFKDGRPTYNTTSNTLSFNNVSYEHFGNYSCAAKDNTSVQSPQITLNVEYTPKNTSVSVSPSGEIVEGSSVTLTCSSNANPPVQNYTWFKTNGAAVWENGSGQSITITNISPGDSGQYYCEAHNKHGAHNSTAVPLPVTGNITRLLLAVFGSLVPVIVVAVVFIICIKRRKTGPSREDDSRHIVSEAATEDLYSNVRKTGSPGREQSQSAAVQGNDLNYATVNFQHKSAPSNDAATNPETEDPSVIYSSVKT
ncbi:B-cell receptor CD22 [Amia ocellicauda]|uniref:B-cell receptor CD22 n=1 Tax=Amia ocellicauda TaxID=2972642 RepID=UPI003463D7E0